MVAVANARLVIADDHPLFRGALRGALASVIGSPRIEEAGSFDFAAMAFARMKRTRPNQVLPGW